MVGDGRTTFFKGLPSILGEPDAKLAVGGAKVRGLGIGFFATSVSSFISMSGLAAADTSADGAASVISLS